MVVFDKLVGGAIVFFILFKEGLLKKSLGNPAINEIILKIFQNEFYNFF